MNTPNDALPLVVLDILYAKEKLVDPNSATASDYSKYVVAPPDNGVDIVVKREVFDECYFDFIQVKNDPHTDSELKQCISDMKRAINDYLRSPRNVSENLRQVLSDLFFDSSYKSNCTYSVVHNGELSYFRGQSDDEKVITTNDLAVISESLGVAIPTVPSEEFSTDSFNNFIIYGTQNADEAAILCSLRGYDLALLARKYTNTSLGRNILFGQNLRESLAKKSKTFVGMAETIDREPEKFWFFNNGITIVAEDFDVITDVEDSHKIDKFILKSFSIINGAQTTSALGQYLKDAHLNNEENKIKNLKKVYILTRILKVTNSDFKSKIAIYNNTQNPIKTRDMASTRPEQVKLERWLQNNPAPYIYCEIKTGTTVPSDLWVMKHQKTTNTELAQLAFAGFLQKPFWAKDKKNSLFDVDYKQEEFVINEHYHKVFHYPTENEGQVEPGGILFKKSKDEINELLFVQYLYKEAKKFFNKLYKEQIAKQRALLDSAIEEQRPRVEKMIAGYELRNAINNICMYYCVTLYYAYKDSFPFAQSGAFKYDQFYVNKEFAAALVKDFANLFLGDTISIIQKIAPAGNVNNWIRAEKSEASFMDAMQANIQDKVVELQEQNAAFVLKYFS